MKLTKVFNIVKIIVLLFIIQKILYNIYINATFGVGKFYVLIKR